MRRKAVKKPVEIEYMTYEDMLDDGNGYEYKINNYKVLYDCGDGSFFIETLEGTMEMTNKDVLIIGVRGEIYPCKIDIFKETYEVIK